MQDEKIKPELKFVSSWDDDNELNYKLAELLQKYNLPAIFYLTNKAPREMIERLGADFEIGGHSVSHNHEMRRFHSSVIWSEIANNKRYIESVLGKDIDKFCYPRGRYNEKMIEQVKKAGFVSARTTEVLKTEIIDPYKEPCTIHIYNRAEYDGVGWHDMAKQWFDFALQKGGVYHLFGHSWEIDKFSDWSKLEVLFEYVSKKISKMRVLQKTDSSIS